MKPKSATSLLAALAVALWVPAIAHAQNTNPPDTQTPAANAAPSQQNDNMNQTNSAEASQMVGARADLVKTLDSHQVRQGQQFKARLPKKVRLKNGTELPAGTMLIGKISQDDMHENGKAKLALCIDQARTRDGKTIPIKATIMSIYPPGVQSYNYYTGDSMANHPSNPFKNGVTKVDEQDAFNNVDLHSNLNSNNSGVLVSSKSDGFKVKSGTEFDLAIAPAENNNQPSTGNPGGSR